MERVAVAEKLTISALGKLSKIQTENDFQMLSVLGAYFLFDLILPFVPKIAYPGYDKIFLKLFKFSRDFVK